MACTKIVICAPRMPVLLGHTLALICSLLLRWVVHGLASSSVEQMRLSAIWEAAAPMVHASNPFTDAVVRWAAYLLKWTLHGSARGTMIKLHPG